MTSVPLESEFKKKFCQRLKRLGCTVLQYQQNATTVKGFPDTIVLLPESLVVFIEFKRARNAKFQPGQKEWNLKLNGRNFYAYICHPDNAEEIFNEIKALI